MLLFLWIKLFGMLHTGGFDETLCNFIKSICFHLFHKNWNFQPQVLIKITDTLISHKSLQVALWLADKNSIVIVCYAAVDIVSPCMHLIRALTRFYNAASAVYWQISGLAKFHRQEHFLEHLCKKQNQRVYCIVLAEFRVTWKREIPAVYFMLSMQHPKL